MTRSTSCTAPSAPRCTRSPRCRPDRSCARCRSSIAGATTAPGAAGPMPACISTPGAASSTRRSPTTPADYDAFWLRYLRAHGRPATRGLHYAGTLLALAAGVLAIVVDWRFVIAAPVIGYGFAWTAHLLLEGNRPETFGHPLWSMVSALRILLLFLTGRLGPHLLRAQRNSPAG